jgi:thiol:disulfide interchange protein DsbA
MSKHKRDQVNLVRNLIIGAVALIVVAVAIFGLLYSAGVTQGEFVAGTHYRVLDNTQRRRPGTPVAVTEFFSYGCIHCKNLDPTLHEWAERLPDGVVFSRVPVAFSPAWTLLAQSYYTLVELDVLEANHGRIFRRIHDRRSMFRTPEEVAEFVDGHGATAEEFLTVFRGPRVRRLLREADNTQRAVGISAVPTLLVAGKYVIGMDLGAKVALEVADFLIAQEQGGAAQPDRSGDEAGSAAGAASEAEGSSRSSD